MKPTPRTEPRAERTLARPGTSLARILLDQSAHSLDHWIEDKLGDAFLDRLRRVSVPLNEGGVDPFGLDPQWAKYALAGAVFLHRHYFRTQVFGHERIPAGPALLVANHSGQIPIDGTLLGASLFIDAEPPRFMRAMVEKWTQTLPFVSTFFPRVGQVVGVPENARRLLEQGEVLLVFPEGSRGITKTFRERYQLADFGLGFMRLAIEAHVPIVPVAVIGGEEQYISVGNARSIAKIIGMPALPIIPQLLLPGGFLPLPTKYRIYFGDPMHFEGDPDDDDTLVEEKVFLVKAAIEGMLARGLAERKSVFF